MCLVDITCSFYLRDTVCILLTGGQLGMAITTRRGEAVFSLSAGEFGSSLDYTELQLSSKTLKHAIFAGLCSKQRGPALYVLVAVKKFSDDSVRTVEIFIRHWASGDLIIYGGLWWTDFY